MIYKFHSVYSEPMSSLSLEVSEVEKFIELKIIDISQEVGIKLNKSQLYDLIGALHSIQAKISKGASNG